MARQTKSIDFWVSVATLLTALFGLVTGYLALQEQNRKLDSLHEPKPLEGIWNYQVDYDVFHKEDYSKEPSKRKRMEGKAAFIWNSESKTSGYDVLISAKIYLVTDTTKKSIVVVSSINRLITPDSGGPASNLSMSGTYLSRLTVDSLYENVGDTNYSYDGLKAHLSADGTHIDKITFDFKSPKDSQPLISKGTVSFSR